MRAAVLMNPLSGGANRLPKVCSAIKSFLKGYEIVAADLFGGKVLEPDILLNIEDGPFMQKLTAAIDAVSAYQPDLYVVAGGDGIAAYTADRLLSRDPRCCPTFVGVAMGTANVGPIITFTAEQLENITPDMLHFESCGAVEAFTDGTHAAYGFNDIVLGNTLLATVDGATCTVSAAAMYKDGSKLPVLPHEHLACSLTVTKNGKALATDLHSTAQIILSTVERERLYGRAIAGVLCFTQDTEEQAAMLLSRRPLVTIAYDPRGYEEFALSSQLLFNRNDRIQVDGLLDDVMIIADGNPIPLINGSAEFRYLPDIIRIGKI